MLSMGGIVTAELNIARLSNTVPMGEPMMIEICVLNGVYALKCGSNEEVGILILTA